MNGPVPAQLPFSAVSVCSTTGSPEAFGRPVLTGGPASTAGVFFEALPAAPAALDAVTSTRRRWPTCSVTGR